MVSDLDLESRLVLHAKQCKLKLAIFIVYLEKYNFLKMTPNIASIYIYISNRNNSCMIKNLGSLPLKSPPFGLDQAPKI